MMHPAQAVPSAETRTEPLAVRFPLPARQQKAGARDWLRLILLPRRWRRQVVIQGQRYWLPG